MLYHLQASTIIKYAPRYQGPQYRVYTPTLRVHTRPIEES